MYDDALGTAHKREAATGDRFKKFGLRLSAEDELRLTTEDKMLEEQARMGMISFDELAVKREELWRNARQKQGEAKAARAAARRARMQQQQQQQEEQRQQQQQFHSFIPTQPFSNNNENDNSNTGHTTTTNNSAGGIMGYMQQQASELQRARLEREQAEVARRLLEKKQQLEEMKRLKQAKLLRRKLELARRKAKLYVPPLTDRERARRFVSALATNEQAAAEQAFWAKQTKSVATHRAHLDAVHSRYRHAAVAVNGDVWLLGGRSVHGKAYPLAFHTFEPSTNSVRVQHPPPTSRHAAPSLHGHSAVVLFDGRLIVVCGGCDASVSLSDTLYSIHTKNKQWMSVQRDNSNSDSPSARFAHSAVAHSPLAMLVFGGRTITGALNDTWLWSCSSVSGKEQTISGSWRQLVSDQTDADDLPAPRFDHAAVMIRDVDAQTSLSKTGKKRRVLPSTSMLVFGGRDLEGRVFGDLWSFDATTSRWTKLALESKHNPEPRFGHTLTCVGSRIMLLGGRNNDKVFADAWVLDIGRRVWTPLQLAVHDNSHVTSVSVLRPRAFHSTCVVTLGESCYAVVFGGCADADDRQLHAPYHLVLL
eukprot:TRINITY_DN66999_c6_g1_i1.p1 TRINITY_DN66999_c6_g1~~TRINITY_DN66999_c6_g1_i1.p1  ORF type:complete len:661 (+),score=287.20 TRINITY_DN66999_c6_g1_i1:210-1985(+)